MRSTLRNSGIILSCSILALLGGCGGGGSNNPDSRFTTNDPPVATAPVVSTGEKSLLEYKTYTFTTTASDPNLGDSVASCLWDFGDGSEKVSVTTAPFSATHVFLATSNTDTVTVTPYDSKGLKGIAATGTFAVTAAPNPFTITVVAPPTTIQPVSLGSTVTVTYSFTVTYSGPGTVSAANLTFNPGSTSATGTPVVTPGTLDGLTAWTVAMPYPAGAVIGDTYTAQASVSLKDSLGVQAVVVPFPTLTFQTVAANPTPPSIAITSPQAASTQIFALQTATMGFTVTDIGTFPTTVQVDWGDGTEVTTVLLQGSGLATGIAPSPAPSHAYASAGTFIVTVSAVDTQAANNTAQPQTRTFKVLANALPMALITAPQASGTLPAVTDIDSFLPSNMGPELTLPAQSLYPQAVILPLNGQLNFNGTATNPGSGEPVTVQWTFPGGNPGASTTLNAGSVSFPGVPGKIVAYLVELKAIDVFGRNSSQVGEGLTGAVALAKTGQNTTPFRKWVIVDGINTKQFTLNLLYRQLTDNNGAPILTPATLANNGFGADMMIFQDGLSNSYTIKSANSATVTVPVRGNLPFYLNLPSFSTTDPVAYMMRIPNKTNQDPSLEAAMPVGSSSFAFVNGNPSLSIVTSQGFAAETDQTAQRRLNAAVSLWLGDKPGNDRWFDRLSVPSTDPNAIPSAFETSNSNIGSFAGIPANQSFAEWPIYLMTMESDYLPWDGKLTKSQSPTTSAGTSQTLGFKLSYPAYGVSSATRSDTYGALAMQAFRVPASTQDPYDLSTAVPGWNLASCISWLYPTTLNLVSGGSQVPAFFNQMIHNPQTNPVPGIEGFQIPYNTNDVNRVVGTPTTRNFNGIASIFSYAEYLWSSVWVRPLVLNNAQLYSGDVNPYVINNNPVYPLANFPYFRTSQPAAWPKRTIAPYIVPDGSAFDLTANGGGAFDAKSPVAIGTTPDSHAVGRFYWTAYTPFYNSGGGALISRTWLSDGAGLPPTTFSAPKAGEAVAAMGFIPPQDTAIDKRGRDANGGLTGAKLGGYRVMWFNPTKDKDGNVVPPDFWVVEISGTNASGQGKTHFMLPSSYPVPSATGSLLGQATTDPILTDARVYLPSNTLPGGTPAANDIVAPGYCWFDVPPELRPIAGSAVVTVFGLKSVLNNNPTGNYRPLNRTDWIDAIKTATANINVITSLGTDLNYVHKIPFNFGWDIVVVNGEATIVAP
jgi:hypothetical protein